MAQKKKGRSDKKRPKKITKIGRFLPEQEHFRLHFSAVVFLVILAYILIVLVRFMVDDSTGVYEVVAGESGHGTTYEAFIVRDEEVFYSEYSGYVSYYAAQGERLGVNDTVCTLDENGNYLSSLITSESELGDETLAKFKSALRSYSISYDPNEYDELYTEKNNLNTTLLSLLTEEMLSETANASDAYTFAITQTDISGIFVSSFDGYEDFDIDNFSITELDSDSYSSTTVLSGQLVEAGSPLYKILPTDEFTIIFQMTEDDQVTYWDSDTIDIYFSSIDKTLTGTFSFIFDQEGNRYAKVDFSAYGYMLANTRYTDIEIYSGVVEGLKIPSSSLTSKDYLMVPQDFVFKSGASSDENVNGCLLQYYDDGEIKTKFVEITIVNEYEDYYLIDASIFEDGDIIVKQIDGDTDTEDTDSSSIYEIGALKTLTGVYSVNKGYAIFRQVNVLSELEDGYVIVQEGYSSSISRYDRIALNADLIQEGEVIY